MFMLKRPPGYIPSMRQLAWFAQAPGRHRPTAYRTARAFARSWWARKVMATIKQLSNALSDLRAGAARVVRKRPVLVPEPPVAPPPPAAPAVQPTARFLRSARHRAPGRAARLLSVMHRGGGSRQSTPARLPRRLQEALEQTSAYASRGGHLIIRHARNGRGLRALGVWTVA